jgi:hypothetical protein
MKIYNKKNIINLWDEVIPKSYYKKMYDEIKFELLNDIFKDEISKIVDKHLSDDFKGELIKDDYCE